MNRSHRLTTRLTTAGLLMASALALSACGEDEPKPRVENQPSEVETTVAAEKPETAEEFIRRWFEVQVDMQNSGDVDEYLSLSPECEHCADVAERVESYYAAGGSIRLEGERVTGIKARVPDQEYVVKTQAGPTIYRTSADAAEEHLPGGKDAYVVLLERPATRWQVRKILRASGL